MSRLFPPIAAAKTYRIDVGDGHWIHVEECGNPAGRPVVFVHGGPGSGCNAGHRRFFDPAHFRIVLVDQRGCGRSAPHGGTRANTTRDLVRDLEIARRQLGIRQWVVFGGSWGATLALVYAQTFPEAVSALVLRGSFLARAEDMEWFFGADGVARMFPDGYDAFADGIPVEERSNLVGAYHHRIHGADMGQAIEWARRWNAWENRVATWTLPQPAAEEEGDLRRLLAKVRIAVHYAVNRYFLADRPLLAGVQGLPDVPISIVHGRRDLVCPFEAGWALHAAIPGSRLVAVPEAGHLAVEPPMIDALVAEMDRLCD